MEVFEAQYNNIDAIQARDKFEFINLTGNVSTLSLQTWDIVVENTCGENLCELQFGMVPQQAGYFGLALQTGRFGFENECDFLTLFPTEIQSDGGNHFEIFNEINLSKIKIDGSFFRNPETENRLYFFKVVN